MTKQGEQYPKQLNVNEMIEFTKDRSYVTGADRYDRPYVHIMNGPYVDAHYLWAQYEQVYILE